MKKVTPKIPCFNMSWLKPLLLITLILQAFLLHAGNQPQTKNLRQEKNQISGKITESLTGKSLPGVSVYVKGTSEGTISDMDGIYTIQATSNDILVFSFIGYLTEEVKVGDQTTIDISLEEDIIGLDEVVVTGYGVQKKSDLTGAIASISGEQLTEMPAISVDQALQGRAAGVSITQNTGMPGGAVTIQIRGISSINGTDPLVIVDGVRSSLNDLNPGDIQSIEILKDAASAAIYGSSGGNGVILVTTKKGQSGKVRTNFNMYYGWQQPWKKMEICNTEELMDINNYINLSKTGNYYNTRIDTLENHDWQDIMFRTGQMQNYDLNFSGGNEKSTYYFSANYTKQEGILRNSDYERFAFRINSDHKLSKLFKVGENVQFTKRTNNGHDEWEFQNEYNSPMLGILTYYPYYGDYDENGNWIVSDQLNPVVTEDILHYKKQNYSVGGNVYLDITPVKGLVITSKLNGYTNFGVSDQFFPIYNYNPNYYQDYSEIYKNITQQWGWELQQYANYNFTVATNFSFQAMAGFEARITEQADMSGTRYNLINESPEMRYFIASTNDTNLTQFVEGGGWIETSYAYFGRLNVDYQGKYLLSFNIRKDYSSRFGPQNRSGVFPSISAGWKFSDEPFIKDLEIFSFGKIRAGYGTTGANAPDLYAYYASVNTNVVGYKYTFDNGIVPQSGANMVRIPNREMHWETMVMTNLGIDLAFLNNKLTFSADYFKKSSKDMLGYQDLPGSVGIYQYTDHISKLGGDARPLVNIGTLTNSGIELNAGYRKFEGDLKASFSLNTTFLKNKVESLPEDSLLRGRAGVGLGNFCLTAVGQPVSQFYGWQTDGLYQTSDGYQQANGTWFVNKQPYYLKDNGDTTWFDPQAKPGDWKIVDQNNDGKIDEKDKIKLGSPIPKIIIGFSTNLEYKNFDLNIFLEGKFGYQIFNGAKNFLMNQTQGINRLKICLDQYRLPIYDDDGVTLLAKGNTDTDLPRYDSKNFNRVIDFYVEDAGYLRIKNIQFGYTLPLTLSSKIRVEKFRIYAGVKNLLTITRYSGFDPEISTGDILAQGVDPIGTYPQSRMYLIGCNVQF